MRLVAAAICASALFVSACGSSLSVEEASWDELRAEADYASAEAPLVYYFWAPWSQESVELAPTVAELAFELEGSARFVLVCVDDDVAEARRASKRMRPGEGDWLPTRIVPVDFDRMLAEFGVSEPPALAIFAGGISPAVLDGPEMTPAGVYDVLARELKPEPGAE